VPEESRVLIVRRLWSLNSDRLETWLIPSGTIQIDNITISIGLSQEKPEKKKKRNFKDDFCGGQGWMRTINKLDEARTKAFDHMMSVWHRAAAAP